METGNLDRTILLVNLMMNVKRGFEKLALQFDDDPIFIKDEDADEFQQFTVEFDFLREAFCRWENKYEEDCYVDMIEIDTMANHLDLIQNYLKNIHNSF